MQQILVVENSAIVLWVYPERRMIHHQVKGSYCFGADFRDALTKGIEAMELHKATKWLSDNRIHRGLPPDDEEWAAKTWFSQAKAVGWKHWAIVQPERLLGQLSMDRIVQRFAERGINARMFGDPDEAMKWLEPL